MSEVEAAASNLVTVKLLLEVDRIVDQESAKVSDLVVGHVLFLLAGISA
jgi:hypothetical protein